MSYNEGLTATLEATSAACGEPIEAALIVIRNPDTGGGGLKRLFGAKSLAAHLRTLNYLVLTPTHLRLFTLGGRAGTKPKDEIAAWPRGSVSISVTDVTRSSYFASTGSHIDYPVHALHITGPGVDLHVDLMAADPVDAEVLGPEPAREIAEELNRLLDGSRSAPG